MIEERYRLLAEHAGDMLSVHAPGPDSVYLYVSPACRGLFGYDPEELVGRSPWSFMHPDELARLPEESQLPPGHPDAGTAEYRFRARDGHYRWVESAIRTLRDPETGEIAEIHAATRDVTQRREAEQALLARNAELARSNAELARSNAALERYAYVASHDLSEPLRTIAGFSQLLSRRYADALDPRADRYLSRIAEGTGRMQALIGDLLAYTRAGHDSLHRVPFDPAGLVERVIGDLSGEVAATGAEVHVAALPARAVGDPGLLRTALVALLANALRFSGDAAPQVRIGGTEHAEVCELWVADRGIGIDAAYHERIFETFERLHPAAGHGGTGTGLAVARLIVERHGGRIWVDSAPGRGATFHLTIPRPVAR